MLFTNGSCYKTSKMSISTKTTLNNTIIGMQSRKLIIIACSSCPHCKEDGGLFHTITLCCCLWKDWLAIGCQTKDQIHQLSSLKTAPIYFVTHPCELITSHSFPCMAMSANFIQYQAKNTRYIHTNECNLENQITYTQHNEYFWKHWLPLDHRPQNYTLMAMEIISLRTKSTLLLGGCIVYHVWVPRAFMTRPKNPLV